MQDEIMRIKKEKDICILAHAYQSHDIWEVADYVGDSFGLAQRAAEAPQKTMIMCGVRFMAETVKLLSPEKTVYLPEPDAGCPMADQIDYDLLAALHAPLFGPKARFAGRSGRRTLSGGEFGWGGTSVKR